MQIDDKLIDYLEDLSKLSLPGQERETIKSNLADIIGYMEKLSELDTGGVDGISHPFAASNVFREDEARPSFAREAILQNAPRSKDGCFIVPKTVEG